MLLPIKDPHKEIEQTVKIIEVFVHPEYVGSSEHYAHDICLVKVEPISLNKDRDIVCLPNIDELVSPNFEFLVHNILYSYFIYVIQKC